MPREEGETRRRSTPPPLEMKEPFLLRRRKTHLLAGNIRTDPYRRHFKGLIACL